MPTIDPGITVVDDSGKALLSPRAIPIPPNMPAIPPSVSQQAPLTQLNPNSIAPVQSPQLGLPNYSIPSDRYKEVEGQAPSRNDPRFQQHGLAKIGNVIASLGAGPFAPLIYNALKQVPYQYAARDWQRRLEAIKPELGVEESQNRERGERERATATLASTDRARQTTEAHQKTIEQQTEEQREIERKREEDLQSQREVQSAAEKRREELRKALADETDKRTKDYQDRELKIRERQLGIEAQRLNKEAKEPGTWTVETGDDGKKYLFNNKTRETTAAPAQGINKPSDVLKTQTALAPIKAAVEYANQYKGKEIKTGAGDEALLEKFFELAKPSSGFRMTKPQQDMLLKARGWKGGTEAFLRHAATGRWFTDDQVAEIVDTMNDLAGSRGIKPASSPSPSSDITIHWPGDK